MRKPERTFAHSAAKCCCMRLRPCMILCSTPWYAGQGAHPSPGACAWNAQASTQLCADRPCQATDIAYACKSAKRACLVGCVCDQPQRVLRRAASQHARARRQQRYQVGLARRALDHAAAAPGLAVRPNRQERGRQAQQLAQPVQDDLRGQWGNESGAAHVPCTREQLDKRVVQLQIAVSVLIAFCNYVTHLGCLMQGEPANIQRPLFLRGCMQ